MWTAQVLEAVPLVDEGLGQTSAELLSDMSAGLAGFQAVLGVPPALQRGGGYVRYYVVPRL